MELAADQFADGLRHPRFDGEADDGAETALLLGLGMSFHIGRRRGGVIGGMK